MNNVLLEINYHKVQKFMLVYQDILDIFLNWGDDVCLPLVWTGSRQVAY